MTNQLDDTNEALPVLSLQPGAMVTTDFSGRITTHRIVDRGIGRSQSGILFQVEPMVPKSEGPDAWIDARWFSPALSSVQESLF